MSGDRELDVVLFGATGFAGRLVAGYLAGHAAAGARIGLAGRSQRRLADVRAQLGAAASAWPLLVADSADPVSLAALARAARVVVTTVGPYRARGLALVQACAEAGTDYADLAGEVLFIRDSIDHCHDAAARAGARIVHCCGFDSVPSDLGVLLLHQAARADDAGDLQDTTLVVTALRGGISGGTLASMMGQQAEVRASAQRRQVAGDPYALSPDRAAEPDLGGEPDLDWARYDSDLRAWTGPFAMAGINTRVVRRSNALQGWAYGRRFRYREVTGFGAGPAAPLLAAAVSAALKAAEAGLAFGPSRAMLSQLLPAPGQGPGEKTRRTGFFHIQIHTRTSAGARYLATIEAQGDPGYAATSVMLGETALCLALDRDHLPGRAGVLTPATAMGAALATRLTAAGLTLTTRQISPLPRPTRAPCPQPLESEPQDALKDRSRCPAFRRSEGHARSAACSSGRARGMRPACSAHTDSMPVRLHHIVVDAHDLPGLARFWTQALGWKVLSEREREIVIGTDDNAPVGMCFMPVTEPKTVKNRVHLDLTSSAQDRDQEIGRLLALGARQVDIGQTGDESWTVLADPEGNEFCVIRPKETLTR